MSKVIERSKQEGKSVAKIRHVVYRAADLEAMATFFVNAFEMTIIRRRPEGGGIDLSDGTINLAVLPVRTPEQRIGFEHIGFMVEDEQQAYRRLEAAGAHEFDRTVDPYQIKFHGPEGIDVEIGAWPGTEPIE